MMPIDLGKVPSFLSGYRDIINACAGLLRAHNGKGCYLTVHESLMPPGKPN